MYLLAREATPPVVIGHSMGGLVMQKLAAGGIISAGVWICPVAPNRMLSVDWGFLRNSVSITKPFAGDEPYEMTPEAMAVAPSFKREPWQGQSQVSSAPFRATTQRRRGQMALQRWRVLSS
ncbi:MAG: alpha/beta hydrolase [Verrucomicrobiaceae bacterium]|nr:MAG: alpha/beta hydrolase [Verrucomicrobiaceae bacterium]